MQYAGVDELIDSGVLFCGTPDDVYEQIADFCGHCGGMGNLLVMAQGGFLDHRDTVDSLTLMAQEIVPRLKEYEQPGARRTAAA